MTTPAFHLVDASPYIFRAFFSLPPMEAPDGAPVSAVYGFVAFLLRLLSEEPVGHLAVAFDGSLTTSFRNDLFPAYKAQRELPPPDLEAQLVACREAAEALGAATFVDRRFEADDLLATLHATALPRGVPAVVVSSDKDLGQLVDERTVLLDFARGERLDADAVRQRFGVAPRQIPDLLALAGDAVDNIPGVAGIGRKTAAALLSAFDDLDDLYAGLDRVPELPLRGAARVAERLAAAREVAFLSRRLATVVRDAPLSAHSADLGWRGAHRAKVDALFARLGFAGIRERIPRWR